MALRTRWARILVIYVVLRIRWAKTIVIYVVSRTRYTSGAKVSQGSSRTPKPSYIWQFAPQPLHLEKIPPTKPLELYIVNLCARPPITLPTLPLLLAHPAPCAPAWPEPKKCIQAVMYIFVRVVFLVAEKLSQFRGRVKTDGLEMERISNDIHG